MKFYAFNKNRVYFQYIFLVLPAYNDLFNTGTLGGQYFFFNTPNRQYLPTQGYFSCHGQVRFYFSTRKGTGKGSHHGDTGTWSIFWYGTFGYVYMNVLFIKHFRI